MSYPYFHGPSGLFVVADGFVPVFQFLSSSSSSSSSILFSPCLWGVGNRCPTKILFSRPAVKPS